MKVKLSAVTQPLVKGVNTPEEFIVYFARVSSPNNQLNMDTAPRLIKYLIKNKHWSPLEAVNIVFDITTSRAISHQLVRHRSMSFQQLSERYVEVPELEPFELRRQAIKNRQSSTEIVYEAVPNILAQLSVRFSVFTYRMLLKLGVARETARMVLPRTTQTRLFINGTLRSWIHFLDVRDDEHAQLEIQEIAKEIKKILIELFPNVGEALEW